ncbi:uncharacterized protein LOC120330458 [Styela clava]
MLNSILRSTSTLLQESLISRKKMESILKILQIAEISKNSPTRKIHVLLQNASATAVTWFLIARKENVFRNPPTVQQNAEKWFDYLSLSLTLQLNARKCLQAVNW